MVSNVVKWCQYFLEVLPLRNRILSLLLAAVMVFSMIPAVSAAEPVLSVVYIPLDNRPFNKDRMELMAAAMNVELIMPPEDLYATVLDGQPKNENGTQYGDRAALLEWLIEQDETYDTFILSLDQLLSGGLMNSRDMTEDEDIILSDGTAMTEREVIDLLADMSRSNDLYLIDSVMRIACNSGYGGYNLDHYTALMLYGRVARPALSDKNLTADNIVAGYRSAASGGAAYTKAGLTQAQVDLLLEPLDPYAEVFGDYEQSTRFLRRQEPEVATVYASVVFGAEEAGDSVLSHYLAARERKLRLGDYAMDTLCGRDNVHYLLGVDDSYSKNNIQTAEIDLLSRHLGENDEIFSALDGLGQAALARLYATEVNSDPIDTAVTYFGDQQDRHQSFNCDTPSEMILQTMDYFGCRQVSEDPELSIVVLTTSSTSEDHEKALCDLVSLLNENEYQGIPTVLVDLIPSADDGLTDMLLENTHTGMLLSYSGRLEIPNSVVMAMSQGVARYRSLMGEDLSREAQMAHLKNLATALLSRFSFADATWQEINDYLIQKDLSPANFYSDDSTLMNAAVKRLESSLKSSTELLFDNFTSGNFITDLSPYTLGAVTEMTLTDCGYPWYRIMEFSCSLSVDYSTTSADTGTFHRAYVLGMTDHTFAPDDPLTREQAAKLILEAVGISPSGSTGSFSDVSDWAKPYVSEARSRGYINGYPDGTFKGSNTITRAEFVTIICNYMEKESVNLPATESVSFKDVAVPGTKGALWYAEAVYRSAETGLVNGYPNGTFCPDDQIKRVEAVAILNRLFGRREEVSALTVARFTDVPDNWCFPIVQEAAISHFEK